jgi:hypothetical protein
MKASDGTNYKFERKQLSSQTIANLALPSEERPSTANPPSSTTETPDPVAVKQKNDELEQKNAALLEENAALRQRAAGQTSGATPVPVIPSTSPNTTYRISGLPKTSPFLNIREGPGEQYPVVGAFASSFRGITLGPRRVTNGWTVWQEITGGGYTGWVNAQYLVAETPPR